MHIDYIGRDGTPYIIGDTKLESQEKVLQKELEDNLLFVEKTTVEGIFTFGCQQMTADYMKDAGYIWASRASVMNKHFDIALMTAYYKEEGSYSYTSCSIDLAHLEDLLKDTEYEIDWTPKVEECDVTYSLKKRS